MLMDKGSEDISQKYEDIKVRPLRELSHTIVFVENVLITFLYCNKNEPGMKGN